MIQAEIGGGAKIDPGTGVQRPGFMIRDFVLPSLQGGQIRISDFRGCSNLVVIFPGFSPAMRAFVEEAARHGREFLERETAIVVVVLQPPDDGELRVPRDSPIVILHDKQRIAYRLSGAIDESGYPAPLVYLTDRFGEIVSVYAAPTMPQKMEEILRVLEFLNHQCPECEPSEWPR